MKIITETNTIHLFKQWMRNQNNAYCKYCVYFSSTCTLTFSILCYFSLYLYFFHVEYPINWTITTSTSVLRRQHFQLLLTLHCDTLRLPKHVIAHFSLTDNSRLESGYWPSLLHHHHLPTISPDRMRVPRWSVRRQQVPPPLRCGSLKSCESWTMGSVRLKRRRQTQTAKKMSTSGVETAAQSPLLSSR